MTIAGTRYRILFESSVDYVKADGKSVIEGIRIASVVPDSARAFAP